jgi:hypothetical protein
MTRLLLWMSWFVLGGILLGYFAFLLSLKILLT